MFERDLFQVRCQPQAGDASVKGAVDDLQFHPGQWLPQALVHPEAEGQVAVCVAVVISTMRNSSSSLG